MRGRDPHDYLRRTLTMLKAFKTVVLAAVAAIALAAPSFAQAPIKIGVLTPLSPPGDASAGQLIVRGAKMGAEEVNAQGGILGGRKIELVIEDDAGTPEKGVAGLRKLASQDKVVAVVGQFHSSVMEATQDLAEQLKVPIFSTQASAKKLTEKHLTYTFRTHVIDADRVALWNKWIQQQGFKRVAILAENTDYGIGLAEETKKQFASMGVKAELKTIIYDHPTMKLTPRGEAFRTRYREQFKEEPVYGALNAYAQVMLLADAINAAKSDKPDDIVKALLSGKFTGWNGTISFPKGEGAYWQQWTPPMLFLQYTKVEQPFPEAKIVFPPDLKTGDLMPAPKR